VFVFYFRKRETERVSIHTLSDRSLWRPRFLAAFLLLVSRNSVQRLGSSRSSWSDISSAVLAGNTLHFSAERESHGASLFLRMRPRRLSFFPDNRSARSAANRCQPSFVRKKFRARTAPRFEEVRVRAIALSLSAATVQPRGSFQAGCGFIVALFARSSATRSLSGA